MRTWTRGAGALALAALLGALPARSALAKETFGPLINEFCTTNGRLPAEPYGSEFPAQCQLCHKAGTFDKNAGNRVQPNWDQFKLAAPMFGGSGDFSFFCPTLTGNQPPVLDPIGDRTADEGVELAFGVSAMDPESGVLSFQADGLPSGASFVDHGDGTADFAWTPAAGQTGNHSVTFVVSDDGSPVESDSETITVSVGDVNRPPILAAIGAHTVYEGAPFAIALQASDPDADALAFSLAGAPSGATLADAGDGSGAFGWTPALASAGDYLVTVAVTDAGVPPLEDSEVVSVTVQARPADALFVKKAKLSKKGVLQVKGGAAGAAAAVEILAVDGDVLTPIGSATANKRGKFKLKTTPAAAPCSVVARIGDLASLPMPVTGAPDGCLAQ